MSVNPSRVVGVRNVKRIPNMIAFIVFHVGIGHSVNPNLLAVKAT